MAVDDALLAPILPTSPSGDSLRYTDVFYQIREARREDDDLPMGVWERPRKSADLDSVIRLTADVLATRSKDLQLAAWWTEASLRLHGLPGLADGLTLCRRLLEEFWDSLHPQMDEPDGIDYRAAPLAWIGSKLGDYVRRVPLTRHGYDWNTWRTARAFPAEGGDEASQIRRRHAIEEGKVAPETFYASARSMPRRHFESLATDIAGARAALEDLQRVCDRHFYQDLLFHDLRQSLIEVNDLVASLLRENTELDIATVQSPEPALAPAISRIDDVLGYAAQLRSDNLASPMPYLIVRAIRWGELQGQNLEPSALPAPSSETRSQLMAAFGESRWTDLLLLSETEMASPAGRGWLDLQRFSARACQELGSSFSAVREAISAETVAMLSRFPRLPDLVLSDGTPAADRATVQWLRGITTDSPGGSLLNQEASGRTRFLARLQMARDYCGSSDNFNVGCALLEDLVNEIEQRHLDDWEARELLLEPLIMLFENSGDDDQRRRLFNRICRLDPDTAVVRKLDPRGSRA